MKATLFLIFGIFTSSIALPQKTQRVLFIGNSYTGVNNLPQIIANIALPEGDTLIFDSNTPGGQTLQGHSNNTVTRNKIMAGNWNYVVLQEQSQLPSFSLAQVQQSVFPYARLLDSLIKTYNPCAETMFYMTWGRKNGDASNCPVWPPVCTYNGMDSLLFLRYMMLAENNNALVSPVGAVWRYIRENYPSIELYQADESHPSLAGSYAAACCFYTTIFRKNPLLISNNYSLPASHAANIRHAVKTVVFDNLLNWHVGEYDPKAGFNYSVSGNSVNLENISTNTSSYYWGFGDGSSSSLPSPTHLYANPGNYPVTLVAFHCGRTESITKLISIEPGSGNGGNNMDSLITIYPNPANHNIVIHTNQNSIGREFTVYNIEGRRILTGKLNAEETRVNLDHLPGGLYIISIDNIFKQKIKLIKF